MQQELICQGGVQINSAVANGGGAVSISVDLPNGPKPGTIWVIDQATCMALLSPGGGTFDVLCEIDIVPIGAPTPDATDTLDSVSLSARGVNMHLSGAANNPFGVGYNLNTYVTFSGKGPVIVPAGYTLRGIVATELGLAGGTIMLIAQLRILQQN